MEAGGTQDLPASSESTEVIAAALEGANGGVLETLAVSVAVVEFTTTAVLGIGPLVADAGVASGGAVRALATSLREGGGDDEEKSGDGSETHFGSLSRLGGWEKKV